MKSEERIFINTIAQYIRTILNLVLSLYSARLILNILGVEDFGIYSLVAGVVSLLSFLTNSMVSSTQRFLSVCRGNGNIVKLKEVFANSMLLHLFIGLLITVVLECFAPLLFNGFLNIPPERNSAATVVYQQIIFMVYISFITSPYRALLVSRENIVYTSIIDVLNAILKVLFVLFLPYIPGDKLIGYGWIMFLISFANLLAFAIYTHINYEECIFPNLKYLSLGYIRQLSSYTGWMVFSTACIAMRTQGLAIVLNRFYGTVINAAYGIGAQISGLVSFVSTSFETAISPQLMASEGGGKRDRMWILANLECKFSFLLLAMIGIPIMFEMQTLLELWLGIVPEYTMLFGCMFLLMQIIDMLTVGLGTARRAIGHIGSYTLITFTPKLLVLPLCWISINSGLSLWWVFALGIFVETLSMLLRIYAVRNIEGFDSKQFFKDVVFVSAYPVLLSVCTCILICNLIDMKFRFFITVSVSVCVFVLIAYKYSLSSSERGKVNEIVKSIFPGFKNFVRKYDK